MELHEINGLIRKSGTGDRGAFCGLVREYGSLVYGLAETMCSNQDDSYELSEKIFLRAWHGISLYTYDLDFSLWLFRLAMDEGIKAAKKQKGMTVPCAKHTELLLHALSGELSIEQQSTYRDHVDGCEGCSAILKAFHNNHDHGDIPDFDVGNRLAIALDTAIMAEQRTTHPMELLGRVRFTIFALIIILILLLWTRFHKGETPRIFDTTTNHSVEEIQENQPMVAGGELIPVHKDE